MDHNLQYQPIPSSYNHNNSRSMPSSKLKNLTNVFHSCTQRMMEKFTQYSTQINISHRNYQSVLNIPHKLNISNNNQEDFKLVMGKDMEYRWEILWPCGAKNPGNIGLLPTSTSLLLIIHQQTPTHITFSTQLLPKTQQHQ